MALVFLSYATVNVETDGHNDVDVWDLDAAHGMRQLCGGVGEPITEAQWAQELPAIPYAPPC